MSLSLGGQIYDPDDQMGKLFFNILATFAEFEVDLIRMRTREGMAVARAQRKLKGRQPKLSAMQQRELKRMHQTGEYTISDLGELFSVSRSTTWSTPGIDDVEFVETLEVLEVSGHDGHVVDQGGRADEGIAERCGIR